VPAQRGLLVQTTRHERIVVFVQWLVETFGQDGLATGTGVLDVAGGKGEISGELAGRYGVPSTLIDPKPVLNSPSALRQVCLRFEEAIGAPEHAGLVQACSVVVGMHPDQATEPLVDWAIAQRKPFAVLPCCVFAKSNADRVMPSTQEPVLSYSQFVAYLALKHGSIRRAKVGFYGRNEVLYMTSADYSERTASEQTLPSGCTI